MSVRVACPHCNAVVALAAVPPSGRAACPRCDETFPVKHAEAVPDEVVEAPPPGSDAPRSPKPFLISLALAVMILAGGLLVLRPWEPPPPTVVDDVRPPGTVPPAALSGLGYLPPTANVVVAVQPAPLLAYAERTGTDAKELLAKSGVPGDILDRIGVPLDQVDHVVVGLSLTDQALPGLTAVLKLRRPLADEDAFLRRLRAEKKPLAGRPVYTVSAGAPLLLTPLDPTTYLLGLTDTDLKTADAPHPPDRAHLPAELRESLAARLSPASFAWVATDAAAWAEKPVLKLALKKDRLARLAQGRAVVVGLALEPDPVLRVAVKAADPAGVRQALRDRLGERATVGGAGDWATAEVPVDLNGEAVRKLIEGL